MPNSNDSEQRRGNPSPNLNPGPLGGTSGDADDLSDTTGDDASGAVSRRPRHRSGIRRILIGLAGVIALFLIWLLRPGDPLPEITLPPEFPEPGYTVEEAGEMVRRRELAAGPLRPDNHARIIWNEAYRDRQAPCSMVYIHGFTASQGEGSPVHARMARDLGCHLYITRLHGHGRRTSDPLAHMHPDSLMADAAHALATGGLLGQKVILAGGSMGGTLSLYLAAIFPDRVDALVLFAPLIDFAAPGAHLFERRWARRLAELVTGEPYITFVPANDGHDRYWYTRYSMKALGTLQSMRQAILANFPHAAITQPVFTGYYYKDEENRDQVVSLSAILEWKEKLGTPPRQRRFFAFPEAGAHVITSGYRAREHDKVRHEATRFLREQLFEP